MDGDPGCQYRNRPLPIQVRGNRYIIRNDSINFPCTGDDICMMPSAGPGPALQSVFPRPAHLPLPQPGVAGVGGGRRVLPHQLHPLQLHHHPHQTRVWHTLRYSRGEKDLYRLYVLCIQHILGSLQKQHHGLPRALHGNMEGCNVRDAPSIPRTCKEDDFDLLRRRVS